MLLRILYVLLATACCQLTNAQDAASETQKAVNTVARDSSLLFWSSDDGYASERVSTFIPQHQLFAQLGMKLRQIEDWVIYDHLELEDQTGMIVDDMLAKLPANLAGIEWHDIVATVDGKTISSVDEFVRHYESAEGEDVAVDVIHKGKRRTIKLNKETVAANGRAFRIGVEVGAVHQTLATYAGLEEGVGLYVSAVHPDKPAAAAGIKQGDVFVKVGQTILKSRDMLNKAIRESNGDEITLEMLRGGKQTLIQVKPEVYSELSPHFGVAFLDFQSDREQAMYDEDRLLYLAMEAPKPNNADAAKSLAELNQAVKDLTAEIATLRRKLSADAE